jgi:hypothetical protein
MTCEVAVMNKRGVALAADSAVTLGGGEKIYHGAEKLFQLSASMPIGIMTYGNANLMGVPWEIVAKSYGRQLGERRFEQLEQCAADLLRYIEARTTFFPQSLQEGEFRGTVAAYWIGAFVRPLELAAAGESRSEKLAALLKKDIEGWNDWPLMEGLGPDYGDKIIAGYGKLLDELEHELFCANEKCGDLRLSAEMKQDLRTVVRNMYTRRWFHPAYLSGIVFAGMGEAELFPRVSNIMWGPSRPAGCASTSAASWRSTMRCRPAWPRSARSTRSTCSIAASTEGCRGN